MTTTSIQVQYPVAATGTYGAGTVYVPTQHYIVDADGEDALPGSMRTYPYHDGGKYPVVVETIANVAETAVETQATISLDMRIVGGESPTVFDYEPVSAYYRWALVYAVVTEPADTLPYRLAAGAPLWASTFEALRGLLYDTVGQRVIHVSQEFPAALEVSTYDFWVYLNVDTRLEVYGVWTLTGTATYDVDVTVDGSTAGTTTSTSVSAPTLIREVTVDTSAFITGWQKMTVSLSRTSGTGEIYFDHIVIIEDPDTSAVPGDD